MALTPRPPPLRGANIGYADIPAAGEGETTEDSVPSQKERAGVRAFLRAGWWWVREYFGEHAYDRYLADWQMRHPGYDVTEDGAHRPMSRRAFFEQQLEVRYGGRVQRCC